MAQVNGPGPSPASSFDTVLNLPGDEDVITGALSESIGGVEGQTTQLNVSDGGEVGSSFDANSGSEVNISGGTVGGSFDANSGSEVNISGGTVVASRSFNSEFRVFDSEVNIRGGMIGAIEGFLGSVLNISGGTVSGFDVNAGSVVNFSGGTVVALVRVESGGVLNISGGTVDAIVNVESGGVLNISGGTTTDFIRSFGGEVKYQRRGHRPRLGSIFRRSELFWK